MVMAACMYMCVIIEVRYVWYVWGNFAFYVRLC